MNAPFRWQMLLMLFLISLAAWPAWAGRRCRPGLAAPDRARLVLDYPLAMPPDRTPENRARIGRAALSPGGRYLVVGTETGHVIAWDLAAGRLLGSRPGHDQPVKLVAFGETDRFVLTGADDLQVVLWDLDTFTAACSFQGAPLFHINEIALCPKNRYVLSRGFDGFGTVWDLRRNLEVMPLYSSTFAFSPDGELFANAPFIRYDASVVRVRDQKETKLLTDAAVTRIAFDPTGRIVATAINPSRGPGKVVLWNAHTGQLLQEVDLHAPPRSPAHKGSRVYAGGLCFAGNSRELLIGCSDGQILLMTVPQGELQRTWCLPKEDYVCDVRIVGSGGNYILAHANNFDSTPPTVQRSTALWSVADSQPLWHRPGHLSVDRRCRLGAVATDDGDLLFVDAATGATLLRLRAFQEGRRWMRVDATTGSCSAGSGCGTGDSSPM